MSQERPILFSGEMVRAILAGRKTQTRRVLKSQPREIRYPGMSSKYGPIWPMFFIEGKPFENVHCPYGQPGDRLWVRETFRYFDDGDIFYKADFLQFGDDYIPVHADDEPEEWKWQPSIFMPRKISRISLEITKVRIERVQEITDRDARAEGVTLNCSGDHISHDVARHIEHYEDLWDSINEKRGFGWQKNPWVWVIEFSRANEATWETLKDEVSLCSECVTKRANQGAREREERTND
jgi:hypothetical protein